MKACYTLCIVLALMILTVACSASESSLQPADSSIFGLQQTPTPSIRQSILTSAQKLDLEKRVDSGTAAVISAEAEFHQKNAVLVGQRAFAGMLPAWQTTPELTTAMQRWKTELHRQVGGTTPNRTITPINVATQEFLSGTQESVTYLAKICSWRCDGSYPNERIVTQKITVFFAYGKVDGSERNNIRVVGFRVLEG